MRKSTKNKEIEELKNQVKKLKEEKKALQHAQKSLAGKLATAKAKQDRYHNELKKKRTTKDRLDQETFDLLMSLLDDISTPV